MFKKYKNVRFLIYGKGAQKDKICEYIQNNKIKNILIKDHLPKNNIPYLLSKCDVALLNCEPNEIIQRYGGSQNKLFDYLASGKPVVAGEGSQFSVIVNNQCGVSKRVNTAEDLLKMFKTLIEKIESTIVELNKKYEGLAQIKIDIKSHMPMFEKADDEKSDKTIANRESMN